jgi:hypothetical protein
MLAGIGVLILSSQFHVMVDDAPKGSGIANLLSIPEAIRKGLPISDLGTVEQRRARRELLQQFGALHEQQVQLRESAAERVPLPPADSPPDRTRPSEKPEPPDPERFESLAARQQELSNRLTELAEQVQSQAILEEVRNPDALDQAIDDSLACMQSALADLRQGHIENLRSSQADMQYRLEDILAELKNHDWAAKIGLLTILSLVLWRTFVPSRLKLIPAPLVAVVIATIVTTWLSLPVLFVEVPDSLWSEIHVPSLTVVTSAPRRAPGWNRACGRSQRRDAAVRDGRRSNAV